MANILNKILKSKLRVLELRLLNYEVQLDNVSQAYKVMSCSRYTFYRYKKLHESGGMEI